jgi:hypothetical protein
MTVSATVDGVTVESSTGTVEDLTASLTPPADEKTSLGTPGAPPEEKTVPPPAADTPADTADDAEPDAASAAGKQLAKRKRDMQAAIDKATWEKHEAIRAREKAEAELQALRNPKPDAPTDGRPKLKSFVDKIGVEGGYETYEDAVEAHSEALTDYKLTARDQASNAAQQTHARANALHQTYTRGVEAHADFDAVLGQFVESGGRLAPATAQEANGPLGDLEHVILTHPKGHSVAYEVSKDPALYARLLGASSRAVFMEEIGELLIRLKGAPTGSPVPPAPVSKAKPPVQPAKGQPSATSGPPGDDASDEEHRLYWNQQEKARRRA